VSRSTEAKRSRAGGVAGGVVVTSIVIAAIVALVVVRLDRPIVHGAAAPAPGALPWPDARIDINAASAAELRVLPGVGPALAERIVDDRAAGGPFATVDDLDRVHRIGPALVESVRPHAVAIHPQDD